MTKPSATGRTYWTSFQHLANSPEIADVLRKEFPTYDPAEMLAAAPSRRRFLKYVAASMALAGVGLTGCRRWPQETLAPYAHKPKDRIEGLSEYYATSFELGGVGYGLLVNSYDGRPIKIEGNPLHPGNRVRSGEWGAANPMMQGQTLSLYDPDRSRGVQDRRGGGLEGRSVEWFRQNVVPQLVAADPATTAVLCEETASPTLLRVRQEFERKFPGATWYTYEPLERRALDEATQAAAGQRLRPVYHLENAIAVVSLDEDYLGLHPNHLRHAADWSVLRASADEEHPRMSRCHIAECRYSLTGASSDYRLPIRPSRLANIAMALAARLSVEGAAEPELEADERDFVDRAAADLAAARGSGLLAWGGHLPSGLQVLCMRINEALGNAGSTLSYVPNPVPPAGTIEQLAQRISSGGVGTLLILGGNPVYDAPANLNFAAGLRNVPTSIHLSLYDDETSLLCTYHVPRAHFLEAWGDTRAWDGTIAPVQPLIMPLFNGISAIELLAWVAGMEQPDGYALVRQTLSGGAVSQGTTTAAAGHGTDALVDTALRRALHDGVVEGSQLTSVQVSIAAGAGGDLPMTPAGAGEGGLEVVFTPDPRLYDGRFANNGWLQEAPEPLTKLTWDNAALMNIHDAEALGVETMDVVNVSVGGRELGVAVYVMPGQPRGVVGLALGYGRTATALTIGHYEDEYGGGFDTYRLRGSDAMWFAPAQLSRQGQRYLLAMTQNHHLIDEIGYEGRRKRTGDKGETSKIVRECSFEDHAHYVEQQAGHSNTGGDAGGGHGHPAHAHQHGGVTLQVFNPPHEFHTPHAWGMTIDMNTCIGCGSCVLACVAENNIPVVGKEQVLNNREMHWLRVDRYFRAEGEDYETQIHHPNPDVALQPMMCVHCENAPCEQVCPVAATLHDTEGLNVMVYNRCIGTRYCSNNCPYKVRKFNYLDWWAKPPRKPTYTATFPGMPDEQQRTQIDAIREMVFNPEVTVRMRGVMEKCTYCIQRIKAKTIWRGNQVSEEFPQGQLVQDGDIKTACQTACPTEAIIFGNINDDQARVTRQQKLPRAYAVLDDLNTRPRTKHLARLRNRDAAAASHGQSAQPEAH